MRMPISDGAVFTPKTFVLGVFVTTNRLLKKEFSWFDGLTTNGKSSMILTLTPFALSPSICRPFVLSFVEGNGLLLRTGLSKGERRVFQHPAILGKSE